MRNDMFKVIVERPRLRYGSKSGYFRDGRKFRNKVWDDEDGGFAFHRLGMKRGYGRRKWLNENLAPLRRWLESQAGRPWDEVYSELCANIDRRNTVQAHIFTHIEDYVEMNVDLVRGEVHAATWRGWEPIGQSRARLYVHPVTRLLVRNRERDVANRERKERARNEAEAAAKDRRDLGALEQLQRIDGIWYRVLLAPLPANDRVQVWDVVRRKLVSGKTPGVYALRKRQLGKKELRHYKL